MGLKCNGGAKLHTHVNRVWGGNAVAGIYGLGLSALRGNFVRGSGGQRNFFAHVGAVAGIKTSGVPNGYRHPGAWLLPVKAGGMSSFNGLIGEGAITDADAWLVKLAEADLSGSGALSAVGGLIVQALADLTGSGEISSASLQAFLQAVASISGAGGLSSTVATGFGELVAAVTAFGTAGGAVLTGTGELAANIVAYGDLTPEGIRDAVWKYIIEAGFSAEQIVRLLAAHAAGAATGLEGSNPQYTGLDGSTVRIDGSYSGGTRTIDSLNGD